MECRRQLKEKPGKADMLTYTLSPNQSLEMTDSLASVSQGVLYQAPAVWLHMTNTENDI